MTFVNNIAIVMAIWQKYLVSKHENLIPIYCHKLDYETAISLIRSKHLMEDKDESKVELFAYTRKDPLSWSGDDRRMSKGLSHNIVNEAAGGYNFVRADMNIDFTFYTPKPPRMEEFEILYGCELGVSSVKKFNVNLSSASLGIFKYTCFWDSLKSLDLSFEDKRYSSVSGSCKISGDFLVATGEIGGLIKEIIFKIFSENSEETLNTLISTDIIP